MEWQLPKQGVHDETKPEFTIFGYHNHYFTQGATHLRCRHGGGRGLSPSDFLRFVLTYIYLYIPHSKKIVRPPQCPTNEKTLDMPLLCMQRTGMLLYCDFIKKIQSPSFMDEWEQCKVEFMKYHFHKHITFFFLGGGGHFFFCDFRIKKKNFMKLSFYVTSYLWNINEAFFF